MSLRANLWSFMLLACVARNAVAQNPGFVPPAVQPALPPLLFVRIAGPAGMQVTFFRGLAKGDTVAAPAVVGLRPGYRYSLAITGVPDFPQDMFCPTLDVHGSLILGDKLRNADFPATLNFTTDDFLAGKNGMMKKALVLERPDTAVPVATKAEQPIETNLPANRDLVAAGRERGQVLALVYMGERQMTVEELALRGLSGTVLMPGEKVLPPPRYLPFVPFACYRLDPVAGAAHPSEWICIPDGGDSGLRAGYDGQGKLRGLDPSDTVAEYEDSRGRKRLAVSNRVCLCVPRFVLLRTEVQLSNQVALFGPGGTQGLKGFARLDTSHPLHENINTTFLDSMANRQKPSGTDTPYGVAITGKIEGLEIKSTLRATTTLDGQCAGPEQAEPLDRPLLIIKWPDKCGAMVGDVVTFTLKYTNQGGRPVTNVAVSDSLAPRFEYVPGSTKTDRESTFTTQPNEAGSSILRWEFPGQLLPRESGVITFQVRIR